MLGPDDVRLLERAATVAALAITKEQAVSAVESKSPRGVPPGRARRPGRAPEEAVAHAQSLGWDIDRPMVVVVAETDEDDERTTLGRRGALAAAPLRPRPGPAMQVRDPQAPVMGFSQEVVALFGVADPADTEQVMRIVADVASGGARRRRRRPAQLLHRRPADLVGRRAPLGL